MKILLTSGPTREPIDGVRFITNFSTGRTGKALAEFFSKRGDEVTCLCGSGSALPKHSKELHVFESFHDLDRLLKRVLRKKTFDAIIHLAAVGDYSVAGVRTGGKFYSGGGAAKLDSGKKRLEILLRRNFKIVNRIKAYAGKSNPVLVAFKLTNTISRIKRIQDANSLSMERGIDLVVHNDLSEIRKNRDRFTIYRKGRVAGKCSSKHDLGTLLKDLIIN